MSVESDRKGRLSPAAGYKPRIRDKLPGAAEVKQGRRTPLPGPASQRPGATPRIFLTTSPREKYGNQSRNTAPRAGLEGFRAGKRAAGGLWGRARETPAWSGGRGRGTGSGRTWPYLPNSRRAGIIDASSKPWSPMLRKRGTH